MLPTLSNNFASTRPEILRSLRNISVTYILFTCFASPQGLMPGFHFYFYLTNFISFLFCLPLYFYFVFVPLSFLFKHWGWDRTLRHCWPIMSGLNPTFYPFIVCLTSISNSDQEEKSSFNHVVQSNIKPCNKFNFSHI